MDPTVQSKVPDQLRIVLIEDDSADAERIVDELVGGGLHLNIVRVTTLAQVRAALARVETVDAVLCAYRGKGVKVRQALEMIRASGAAAPLIVVSSGLSDEQATECMRLGATDYILKDRLGRLPHALTQAIQHARTERAQRHLERTYSRLFENIPMAVFRTTDEGRVLDANSAAVTMFGFDDLDGLKAISAFDLYADAGDRRALITRLETEGFLLDVESRMRRVDGSEFWFSRSVHIVREEDGALVLWESIGRDNTEQRESLRQLRESEAYLKAVIETAPDAVVRMDEAGDITGWNSAAEAIFGWARAEVLGERVSETIFPPELRERHQHGLARVHPDGSSTLIGRHWDTFDGLRKSGEVFPIELSASDPIPLGQSTQVVGFVRDISDRKRAQDELAHSEERLRSLLTGAPVAVVTLDPDGRFTFAGGSVFDQLGIDPATIVGLNLLESFPDRPDFIELWDMALENDFQRDVEFAGRTFHVRGGPFLLTPGGDPVGVRAVAFDYTEQVEANRALRRSEATFRQIFEQSPAGISLSDIPRDGQPTREQWNPRMLEMLGAERSADGDLWRSMFTPEEQEGVAAGYARLLSGEVSEIRERRVMTRPDGKTIWVDWSAVLVRDDGGQPLRFQTMAVDVTEQIGAETRLSRRAAQQAVLVELSRAGLEGRETSAFLAAAVELVARGTETQFGTILEMRPSDNALVRVAIHGDTVGITPDPVPLNSSFLMIEALKAELPVVAQDYEAESGRGRTPWMIASGVMASMAVGIRGPISPFGVLTVHSNIPREFSADDLQFMQLAASIISVAVERKREEKQRKLLLGRLVTAQEAERKSIAEDIHDDAVQVMTAANMRLELFRMVLTDPVQLDAAHKLQETISLAIGRLRNMIFQLIPRDLDRHGLATAFRRHLELFEADSGVRCALEAELDEEPAPQVRILMFRIFQEALMNVRKHARATTVTVSVKAVDSGVMMRLADDGVGFVESAEEPLAGHLGLPSMRERAEIAGGWLRLTSESGKGTEVLAWVPAPRDLEPEESRAADVMAVG